MFKMNFISLYLFRLFAPLLNSGYKSPEYAVFRSSRIHTASWRLSSLKITQISYSGFHNLLADVSTVVCLTIHNSNKKCYSVLNFLRHFIFAGSGMELMDGWQGDGSSGLILG
jgi:hypothetical protein